MVNSCLIGLFANRIALILSERRGVELSHASNYLSRIISAVLVARALSSALALERDTALCFFDFHAMGEVPIKMQ